MISYPPGLDYAEVCRWLRAFSVAWARKQDDAKAAEAANAEVERMPNGEHNAGNQVPGTGHTQASR